jgi:hypothetical protein
MNKSITRKQQHDEFARGYDHALERKNLWSFAVCNDDFCAGLRAGLAWMRQCDSPDKASA